MELASLGPFIESYSSTRQSLSMQTIATLHVLPYLLNYLK